MLKASMAGGTVEEAKQSILDAIAIITEEFTPVNIPSILKGKYNIVYDFDPASFLNYYKGIFTNAALEKITGINQRQLPLLVRVEKAPPAAA